MPSAKSEFRRRTLGPECPGRAGGSGRSESGDQRVLPAPVAVALPAGVAVSRVAAGVASRRQVRCRRVAGPCPPRAEASSLVVGLPPASAGLFKKRNVAGSETAPRTAPPSGSIRTPTLRSLEDLRSQQRLTAQRDRRLSELEARGLAGLSTAPACRQVDLHPGAS